MSLIDNFIKNTRSRNLLFLCVFFLLLCLTIYCYPIHSGDDFYYQIRRLSVLIDALKDGLFPFYLDYETLNGYGYFTKAFYCDLLLIPFAVLGVFTGPLFAYKSTIFVITILCFLFTYKCINRIWNVPFVAFICALLYTFSYYRLFDIYNRAAFAESISLTFIPLVFLGVYEIIFGNYKKWYILTIGYSLLLFSHLAIPVIVFIALILFLIIYRKKLLREPKRFYYLILSGFVSLFIVAYFFYPMIEQMLSNDFFYETDSKKVTSIAEGLSFRNILKGLFIGTSYTLDLPGTGIILTWLLCLRLFIVDKSKMLKTADIFTIVGIIFILVVSPLYPWGIYPFSKLNFIQFSWRFFTIITFLFSISGAVYLYYIFNSDKRRYLIGIPFVVVLTTIMIITISNVYRNNYSSNISVEPAPDNNYWLYGADFLPSSFPLATTSENDDVAYPSYYAIQRGTDSVAVRNVDTKITNIIHNKGQLFFDVQSFSCDSLELPLVYYKGYAASLNGENVDVSESKNGLIQIPIGQSGNVKVYYAGTFVQKLSCYLTILSIIALLIYIFVQKRKRVI